MTSATPTGRKIPTLPLTAAKIRKITPLIEKSKAAVLYDFTFLVDSLLTVKVSVFYSGYIEFIPFYFNSLYFDVAMSPIPIIRTAVWLGWKVPKNVQAADPRATIKPA